MADDHDATQEALDPLDYLTSSEHRVQVLDALTETIPPPGLDTPGKEPRELQAVTGASDATVNRILNELDERGWAERDATGNYKATPIGQSISIEFAPVLDSMEVIQHLGDAVALLPLSEISIGLSHFSGSTIREPQGPQPNDFMVFLNDSLRGSSTFYALTYVPGQASLIEEVIEQSAAGNLDSITVYAEHIVEFMESAASEHVIGLLEAGEELYVYDGHISCNIFIFDEIVVFENSQMNQCKDGTAIVTHDGVVREWALNVFERYQDESAEFTVEDLPE